MAYNDNTYNEGNHQPQQQAFSTSIDNDDNPYREAEEEDYSFMGKPQKRWTYWSIWLLINFMSSWYFYMVTIDKSSLRLPSIIELYSNTFFLNWTITFESEPAIFIGGAVILLFSLITMFAVCCCDIDGILLKINGFFLTAGGLCLFCAVGFYHADYLKEVETNLGPGVTTSSQSPFDTINDEQFVYELSVVILPSFLAVIYGLDLLLINCGCMGKKSTRILLTSIMLMLYGVLALYCYQLYWDYPQTFQQFKITTIGHGLIILGAFIAVIGSCISPKVFAKVAGILLLVAGIAASVGVGLVYNTIEYRYLFGGYMTPPIIVIGIAVGLTLE